MPHYAGIERERGGDRVVAVWFYSTPLGGLVLPDIEPPGISFAPVGDADAADEILRNPKAYRGRKVAPGQWRVERRPPDDPTPERER